MVMSMDPGPFLDPFHLTNPCCCCCGSVPIANGVRTVATVSMVEASFYGVMGVWFVYNAMFPGFTSGSLPVKDGLKGGATEVTHNNHNIVEILLICAITSLLSAFLRFLTSLFLMRSLEKESKASAKVWVVVHYGLVVVVTAIVLAASQKNDMLFKSFTIKTFLCFAGVDFLLLLYFLWIIIVYLKEPGDMPGL